MRGISWPAEKLLTYQEELCPFKSVNPKRMCIFPIPGQCSIYVYVAHQLTPEAKDKLPRNTHGPRPPDWQLRGSLCRSGFLETYKE